MADDLQQYIQMQRAGSRLMAPADGQSKLRIAIIADHAPQQYVLVLKAAIAEFGVFPEIYEAEYGTAALEAFDRSGALHAFDAEVVVYSICVQKYRARFLEASTPGERDGLPDLYVAEVLDVVDALAADGRIVVVNNFALPVERHFGNFGLHTNQSLYGSVVRFNALLAEGTASRESCVINDVMYLAARVGADQFLDERLWLSAKYPCANRYLPELARSVARAVMVRRGRVTKVLLLDLDNTLWGGIIGDDGLKGIRLGGDAEGEAFRAFQSYIKSLKARGYVLAVCSKNDEANALEVFRKHPEMVLREEDIAVFVANWNDKASNIEYVSRVLNLGLDSFVFIDDMPFERNLVREAQPLVAVPEMPEDASEFVAAIERSGLLESTGFSEEDARRNLTYREEALRTTEQIKYGSIDEYLASLDMKSKCLTFQRDDIPRVAQLIQRSNQFNLRTQRITESQCAGYLNDGRSAFGIQVRLSDRFGDHGLIAAVCCDVIDDALFVTELVMSCRVLKRGVESLIMNFLFSECTRRGLQGVKGEYVATTKNGLVKDFYRQFGFELLEDDGKTTAWFLAKVAYQPRTHFIQ